MQWGAVGLQWGLVGCKGMQCMHREGDMGCSGVAMRCGGVQWSAVECSSCARRVLWDAVGMQRECSGMQSVPVECSGDPAGCSGCAVGMHWDSVGCR